jgi:3-oxoacyl-[acyl-carrier-protein] synthase-3
MNKGRSHNKVVFIVGTGSYLPERILTNADLEKMVDTSHEWIHTRTGISERHIARDDEATSDMATVAAQRAIESAGIAPSDVDMILVASITPDMVFPNTGCLVQDRLGAKKAFCFGVEAACSGFIYGMEIGRQFVASGAVRTALIIGSEKLSCITDWKDRATCVLFGDGAGAVVLQAKDTGRGIMATVMGSDGSLTDLLNMPAGGSRQPSSVKTVEDRLHFIKMEGKEVFKHAVRCMADACLKALDQAGLTMADIRLIVPHQANMRIIQAIADRLGAPAEKLCLNLANVGNMSSASVPVALDEAVRAGRLKKGDMALFVAFGGGFTWGATVLEWGY